jgi:hypothetical protein
MKIDWTKWTNMILAGTTFGALCISHLQYTESLNSNEAILKRMDSTMCIENRAFLSLEPITKPLWCIVNDTSPADNIQINIHNIGKTPAYNVRICCTCSYDSLPIDTLSFKKKSYEPTIFPDHIVPIDLRVKMTVGEFRKVSYRSLKLYGVIYYLDYFKKEHFIHFNYSIFPNYSDLRNDETIANTLNVGCTFKAMHRFNDCN